MDDTFFTELWKLPVRPEYALVVMGSESGLDPAA